MPININVQPKGQTLLAGLAGAGYGMMGAEEGRRQRKSTQLDEAAVQARVAQIEQQIAESQAAMQANEQQSQQAAMLNQAMLEGAQWINPPADAEEQVIRENFDESLLKDARLKNVPDEQAEPVRRTARAAFQRFYGNLSPQSRAVLMRSDPREFQQVLGMLMQREREAQDAQVMQEAQARAQEMQANGLPVDISGAQSGQEAMAALDQAQDEFETAQAFEAQKQEVVQFYSQKIAPQQGAEGQDASGLELTRTEQLERKKALIKLAGSRTPEELEANATRLEILIDPNGALARVAQLEPMVAQLAQENEQLRAIAGLKQESMQAVGEDRMGLFQKFNTDPPRKTKEEMAPIAGESPPERAPVEGVTEQAAKVREKPRVQFPHDRARSATLDRNERIDINAPGGREKAKAELSKLGERLRVGLAAGEITREQALQEATEALKRMGLQITPEEVRALVHGEEMAKK